ncbi:hypothetical protein HY407_05250 [Candidatus Gottesmanbacteria bacterium]|nr:hypothetical protein [Candidatus Gottesmanbacteria bacterium]
MLNISSSIKSFARLHPKNKILILSLLAFTFLLGFLLPVIVSRTAFSPTSSLEQTSPSPTPIPATVKLHSSKSQFKVGESFSLDIILNSNNQPVEAADFVLNYDPIYLKATQIVTGNYFGQFPTKKIDKDFIKISAVAAYKGNKIIIPQGEGVVATLTFVPLKKTTTTIISFDTAQTIVASGGQNITGLLSPLSISVD